jgi:hypothetical protein
MKVHRPPLPGAAAAVPRRGHPTAWKRATDAYRGSISKVEKDMQTLNCDQANTVAEQPGQRAGAGVHTRKRPPRRAFLSTASNRPRAFSAAPCARRNGMLVAVFPDVVEFVLTPPRIPPSGHAPTAFFLLPPAARSISLRAAAIASLLPRLPQTLLLPAPERVSFEPRCCSLAQFLLLPDAGERCSVESRFRVHESIAYPIKQIKLAHHLPSLLLTASAATPDKILSSRQHRRPCAALPPQCSGSRDAITRP